MLLWTSDRFVKRARFLTLYPQTIRGWDDTGVVCIARLKEHLDLPERRMSVWFELHDRPAAERLKLTTCRRGSYHYLFADGKMWSSLGPHQVRLLCRLGLVDGKRDCLWLQVWYREV